MNGFTDRGLNEGDFDEPHNLSVKTFDAFPKTKKTYLTTTRHGGIFTIVLVLLSAILIVSEVYRWFVGETTHTFSVEKGIGHEMQINLDVVVAMRCPDLHINVQDASGDRILAGDKLVKDHTRWEVWTPQAKEQRRKAEELMPRWQRDQMVQYQGMEDVHNYLGAARKRKSFSRTPKLKGGLGDSDACRIWGSLEGNKVQGDFHITARGHGYMAFGDHLDHNSFNFSHHINELSFGPFIPSLDNPLDNTHATTPAHFYKFQYYVSIVPTIYTTDMANLHYLDSSTPPSLDDPSHYLNAHNHVFAWSAATVYTNQYAVTEQSHGVGETGVPGVFMKYDIEPILLMVGEESPYFLGLVIRCVNVVAGVMVAGGWLVSMLDWAYDVWGRRRRRQMVGMLSGSPEKTGLD